MPTRSLEDFGAVGDGSFNNDAAIAAAIASGDNIHIPKGNYLYTKSFTLPEGATWEGDGYNSNLIASARDDATQDAGGIVLQKRCRLRNLRRTYTGGGPRESWENGHAVAVRFAEDFEVSGCFIDGGVAGGVLIRASTRGNVFGNTVTKTLADGIHVTGGATNRFSSHINIHDNQVVNTGDDCIAVVSFVQHGEDAINRYISIRGNQTFGGAARGIAVAGGSHVIIAENIVVSPAYAGVLVYAEDGWNLHGGTGISIENNTLIDTGSSTGIAYASIMVGGRQGRPFTDIMIRNNRLYGCRQTAITLFAPSAGAVSGVQVTGNLVRSANNNGLYAVRPRDLRCEGNELHSLGEYGVITDGGDGFLKVNGNVLTDVSRSPATFFDAIMIQDNGSFGAIEVRNNLHRSPEASGVERLVECFYDNVVAENNIGGTVTLGSQPVPDDRQRVRGAGQSNSAAPDLATLTSDFNALLQRLRDAGLIEN